MSVDYIGGIVLHQKYGGRGMDVSQKCVRRVGYTLCIRNGYMYMGCICGTCMHWEEVWMYIALLTVFTGATSHGVQPSVTGGKCQELICHLWVETQCALRGMDI